MGCQSFRKQMCQSFEACLSVGAEVPDPDQGECEVKCNAPKLSSSLTIFGTNL